MIYKINRTNNRRCAQLLRRYRNKIARCHTGRLGRVTDVRIGVDGRPIFIGHTVDPAPSLVFKGEETRMWIDWEQISWQSVAPKWVKA